MKRTGRGGNPAPGRPETPRCPSCATKMSKASVTEWKCSKSTCDAYGQPVNTGVYPT